ncbi:sulfite exporter TauE/SafE family protein [Deinococcus peraridilitoris]|uniref:Probable membrane transporter protein n=1 Tax=Deinococcus peraridilitoris (strain DSM 19664 / LMG 22246 / CIP 109416 / KR-200) TaxID=937777 RepID=L0A0Y1_DEIPD|nr:sulfite exporter TauE/SafE family protein [Deinococcus peraridilitoris]AFZ66842.1 putative permease [Deinococcus peraridilitoris DSM 19664]
MILAILAVGLLAGVLGAILGLGGGVVVVPALEFVLPLFGRDITIQQAVAASQVGVLAVGLSGAAAYLQRGLVRARVGYLLSPYTVVGGAMGSLLGLVLPARWVALVFALLLLYSAYTLLRGMKRIEVELDTPSPLVPPAMTFAGVMSGLLGIGGGTVQVPVMNLLAGIPIREAIATSTFIMGLTAVGNAMVYHAGGLLDVQLAGTVALGVLIGARAGASLQQRIPAARLKLFFSILLIFTAGQLLFKYWV